MKNNINIFIDYINRKRLCKGFFARLKCDRDAKKFIKIIYEGSPSFSLLWDFADFIKLSEKIFFRKNTPDCKLYSSSDYKEGQNGFKLIDSNVYRTIEIVVKLYTKSQKIAVAITYKSSEPECTRIMEFENGDWKKSHTVYDEMLLENIISIINTRIVNTFREYYHFSSDDCIY